MRLPAHCVRPAEVGVHIVSFSGVHGSGKSTLIGDLRLTLEKDGVEVATVPSVSTQWFTEYKNHALAHELPVPQTYDDINRLGLRERMQTEMPGILQRAVAAHVVAKPGIILVDRWFSDIDTYSDLEIPDPSAAHTASAHAYGHLLDRLREKNFCYGPVYLTHVVIPSSACEHRLPVGKTDEKAHRGTTPVDLWESVYARVHGRTTDPQRICQIASAHRLQRVREVLAVL